MNLMIINLVVIEKLNLGQQVKGNRFEARKTKRNFFYGGERTSSPDGIH